MPRDGKHPLKHIKKYNSNSCVKPITITTVVHIPMQEGYWKNSSNVLKLFFESLFSSTSLLFDLMVFDNCSCTEVQDYLQELFRADKIQYLTSSKYNLKKLGAMDYLFSVARGDYIIFSDSDVYFLPGWLEKSLKILDTFPEAGQVSALPTIFNSEKYITATLCGIDTNKYLNVEIGTNFNSGAIYRRSSNKPW